MNRLIESPDYNMDSNVSFWSGEGRSGKRSRRLTKDFYVQTYPLRLSKGELTESHKRSQLLPYGSKKQYMRTVRQLHDPLLGDKFSCIYYGPTRRVCIFCDGIEIPCFLDEDPPCVSCGRVWSSFTLRQPWLERPYLLTCFTLAEFNVQVRKTRQSYFMIFDENKSLCSEEEMINSIRSGISKYINPNYKKIWNKLLSNEELQRRSIKTYPEGPYGLHDIVFPSVHSPIVCKAIVDN